MPPHLSRLSGLLDFEAAVRLGSFRAAAQALHKTPSALSHQIKTLEQALGLVLFVRHARHTTPTPEARALAHSVQGLVRDLGAQIDRLRLQQDPAVVRVSTTHSLALKWLVPRLHRFTQQHPALDIRVDASDALADLEGGGCDVALRYEPAANGALLYREHWVVVFSPQLGLDHAPWPLLLRQALLHEGDTVPWRRLLHQLGLEGGAHLDFSRSFSHAGLLVQAAVAGQGLALVPFALAQDDLARGALLRVPCAPLVGEYGYGLHVGAARADTPAVQALVHWLQAEWRATEAGLVA